MSDEKGSDVTVITDAVLLKRFREGDITSFEMLFNRHYDMVYGVLFRLTGTREEAEDRAQEVFLKLYHAPLRHRDNVSGWLYRVAINTGYNALRTEQRRRRREQSAGQQNAGREASPEESVTNSEMRDAVHAALSHMDARSAKLLVLREMGFSYSELADILDIAPGSVGKLLSRARAAFEKAYRHHGQAQFTREDGDG